MSSEKDAIAVEHLGKVYRIYDKPVDRLKQALFRRPYFREFPALSDVSFSIRHGETVGVMGRNGSGKSTLLQMITGTLTPSAGSIRVDGRVAALLELGAGFNPDFTGRENVYLNASILGLSQGQVEERFDRIAAFAEIGSFIDQPVRTYSSGMYVRLAFAVAINVDPDIMIVDEALSVGDEAFQRKCFARLQDFQSKGGTLLFVSHSAAAVVELCERAILLDGGEFLMEGEPKTVVANYQRLLYAPAEAQPRIRQEIRDGKHVSARAGIGRRKIQPEAGTEGDGETADYGDFDPHLQPPAQVEYEQRGAEILDPHLETLDGRRVNILRRGQRYRYVYDVACERDVAGLQGGMQIKTISGVLLGGAASSRGSDPLQAGTAGETLRIAFEFSCNLLPGTFFLNCGVSALEGDERVSLHRILDAVMFRVAPEPEPFVFGPIDFLVEPSIGPAACAAGLGGTVAP